jgi:hypothetical protein
MNFGYACSMKVSDNTVGRLALTEASRSEDAIAAHRPFRISNIRHWSAREWGAIFVVSAFLLVLAVIGAPSSTEKQQLRAQFHLPDGVALAEVSVDRSSTKPFPAPIEGVVKFTDAEFSAYAARLDDANDWKPIPITYAGTEYDGPFADDTLVWRNLDGARQIAWGELSWAAAQKARNGRLLCFAVRESGSNAGKPVFRGEPCPPPNTPSVNAVFVQGLLDFDTKELHMLIRQTRP